ncbi:MAG: hypothetical protein WCX31_04130 [Salinivirgaceae bacterium]|jgi:hypothetical protein
MSKISTIDIENAIISITKIEEEDYICLTDMAKAKDGDYRAADVIKNWSDRNNFKIRPIWWNLCTSRYRI